MVRLSTGLLETMVDQGQGVCYLSWSARYRVKVYTLEGVQIGLPGVGEGVNRLTLPAGYVIKEAMEAPLWIRFATEKEIEEETPAGFNARWWREINFKPRAFCYCDGMLAFENQPIGLCGPTITALAQTVEPELVQEIPCIDVSGIETPPTP